MKSLTQFINEAYEIYRLDSVTVKYDVAPKDFIIQAPTTFQESDIQQYIDDKFLKDLPSNNDKAKHFFGKNAENISDAYFEYDGYEHLTSDEVEKKSDIDINLEWDPKFTTNNNNDKNLDLFSFKNLKYVISFDGFDLLDGKDKNIKDVLATIFKATVSNNTNVYPITISLDTNNIEFEDNTINGEGK